MTAVSGPPARCAAHPSRIALDRCPTCQRPRCGTDGMRAGELAVDCPTCRRERAVVAQDVPEAPRQERLVRAALAASATAMLGAVVSSQYVGAGYFAYALPALAALLTGTAAMRAAGLDGRGAGSRQVRLIALLYSVIGTAYSFRFVIGSADPFTVAALGPYLATAVGVVLGTRPPPARGRRT